MSQLAASLSAFTRRSAVTSRHSAPTAGARAISDRRTRAAMTNPTNVPMAFSVVSNRVRVARMKFVVCDCAGAITSPLVNSDGPSPPSEDLPPRIDCASGTPEGSEASHRNRGQGPAPGNGRRRSRGVVPRPFGSACRDASALQQPMSRPRLMLRQPDKQKSLDVTYDLSMRREHGAPRRDCPKVRHHARGARLQSLGDALRDALDPRLGK